MSSYSSEMTTSTTTTTTTTTGSPAVDAVRSSVTVARIYFDDQGFFFTLALAVVLISVVFLPITYYIFVPHRCRWCRLPLWVFRLYRTNHTVQPPPSAAAAAAAMVARPEAAAQGELEEPVSPTNQRKVSLVRSPCGRQKVAVVKRKRVGTRLPLVASLRRWPTWQDWTSIEEPSSLYDVVDVDEEGGAEMAAATLAAAQSGGAGTGETKTAAAGGEPVKLRINLGADEEESGGTPLFRHKTEHSSGGPLFTCVGAGENTSLLGGEGGEGSRGRQQYGTLPTSSPNNTSSCAPREARRRRTVPFDPQVRVYIAFLKYAATALLAGSCFTLVIGSIASSDDAMERRIVRRDTHRCRRDGGVGDPALCGRMSPYCSYEQETGLCQPVALRGLYDSTIMNIAPGSPLWPMIALLNAAFGFLFIVTTVYLVRRLGPYSARVMALQMEKSLGYRVACVRGLPIAELHSLREFRRKYVDVSAYFPSEDKRDTEFYEELNVSGQSCCVALASCDFVSTGYDDVRESLKEEAVVEKVVVTRTAPRGMIAAIARAERRMARLQEVVAAEKALRRQHRTLVALRLVPATETHESNSSDAGRRAVTASLAEEPDDAMLLRSHGHCCSSCCHCCCSCCMGAGEAAVPKAIREFRESAAELNAYIEKVPQQMEAGGAFVLFTNSLSAYEFVHLFNARFGSTGSTGGAFAEIAGPPGHTIENNLNLSRWGLRLRYATIFFLFVLMVLVVAVPAGVLGSLDGLSEYTGLALGRALRHYYYTRVSPKVRGVLTAYLPVLALSLFYVLLPYITRSMAVAMGATTKARCDEEHLYLQSVCMVLTAVVFQALLQGGLANLSDALSSPSPNTLADLFVSCVTPQGGYWYAKVIMAIAATVWLELLDPFDVALALVSRGSARIQRSYDALFSPCAFDFPRLYSVDMMILSIGVLFHMTAPLLTLCVGIYFLLRCQMQRGKLYDRYSPTLAPEHDCTDFGIIAMILRFVVSLYAVAEVGNLLLLSVRESLTAVVISAVTCASSFVLLVYVIRQSHTWVACLDTVRAFHREKQKREQQRRSRLEQNKKNKDRAAAGDAGTTAMGDDYDVSNNGENEESASLLSTEVDMGSGNSPRDLAADPSDFPLPNCRPDSNTSCGGGARSPTQSPWSPVTDNAAVRQYEDIHFFSSFFESQRSHGVPAYSADTEPAAAGGHHHSYSTVRERQEGAAGTESSRSTSRESTTNPFVGHLLPRTRTIGSRYQPKHQRLAPICIEDEIAGVTRSEFTVERYWDDDVSWFEEAEVTPAM